MKVLLIDADPGTRENFSCAVRAALPCEVVGTDDFAPAWTLLMEAEPPFDVVFADPGAVDGAGFEWLRQIRLGSWHRPVSVVLCLEPGPAPMARAVETGARHFVFKPCVPHAIATKLRQIARVRSQFHCETASQWM